MDMKQALAALKTRKKTQNAAVATKEEEEFVDAEADTVEVKGVRSASGLKFRALAISMLSAKDRGGADEDSSSSSSSESESDSDDEDREDDEAAKEKAKMKQRERLQKKFVKKLKSRSDMDAAASATPTAGFPTLASAAILKFKKLPQRPLRTNMQKHSDPCLMRESQSLSSEDEDEAVRNYGTMRNDANQTMGQANAEQAGESIDAVFDTELGFSATSKRILTPQPSMESSGMERLTVSDKETLVKLRQSQVRQSRSTSNAGVQQSLSQQQPSRPSRGLHRSVLRLYGKINNSYFAYWLVVCSLVVIALDIVAIIFVKFTFESSHDKFGHRITDHRELVEDGLDAGCDWRLMMLRGMHYVGIPNVLLVAPVVFSSDFFALYKTTKDNRIVRCAYLQLCEVIITAQMGFMIYFACDQVFNLPETVKCHELYTASEIALLYSSLVVWFVLVNQIVLFCRFITHQKLQADGGNDANHTSQMSSWMKRIMSWPGLGQHGRNVKTFKKRLYREVIRGDVDAAQKLLEEAKEKYGITCVNDLYHTPTFWAYSFAQSCKNPLHVAALHGNIVMVHLLILHGFDVNALDKVSRVNFNMGLIFKICTRILIRTQDGLKSPLKSILCTVLLPPIHGAVASGHVNVVRLLIENGADVNALPRASFYYPAGVLPPIFVADDPQVLQLLVSNGANFLNVSPVSLTGLMRTFATPLQRATFTLRSSLSDYLVESGGDVALTPLHTAAAVGNIRKVKWLLAHGTHVDTLGERVDGVHLRTPLHWAAIVGRVSSARILLRKGANPNARDRDGRTPLHWAAHNDHPEMVDLLLQNLADPNAQDLEGNTILCFAAEAEGVSVHTISSLVGAGASLKHQCADGDTALHIALQRENRQTALALIKCGANMMTTNSFGKRPVDCTTSTELQFALKKEAGSRDVMISYTHTHFEFAQQVREYLENKCALTCWMDTMDPSGIGGGAVWREEIARGIQKCSVVLSLVCDGYTKSEWCLKELALAKNIRKPVVGLIVEEGSKASMAPLENLVPVKHRIIFNDFITSKRQDGRKVLFDIDEDAFVSRFQTVLPILKTAMSAERRLDIEEKELRAYEKAERYKIRQMTTVLEHLKESREHGDEDDEEPQHEEHEEKKWELDEEEVRGSNQSDAFEKPAADQYVLVYSHLSESLLKDKVLVELDRFGLQSKNLDVENLDEQLESCRCIVLIVDNAHDMDRHARKEIVATMTRIVRTAGTSRKRVFPVFEYAHFLDLSKMYSLARSEFHYFVQGVNETRSKTDLVRHLRSFVGVGA